MFGLGLLLGIAAGGFIGVKLVGIPLIAAFLT